MGMLSYQRRLTTAVEETSLLVSALDDVDLSVPVPTCPGWTLNQLLRHLGFAHRWIEQVVRERHPTADKSLSRAHSVDGFAGESAAELGPWLMEGVELFEKAMLGGIPDDVAVFVPGEPSHRFWSRRMAHETWVHRYDAFHALGLPFEIDRDVAWDAMYEWMLILLPIIHARRPALGSLLGQGHRLRFFATDYTSASSRWTVDLSGDVPMGRRDVEMRCSVYVRAPIADLVLMLYGRRRPAKSEVTGDKQLLREFIEAARF
ncbi:maleylpyruvate isomerase family mycothiol-dependent enzyme [Lentzea sp. NPDC058450]|uniref:maleylpyruvate isomerase family mycothiol-dependent enzyme n=1 Tax=Lentzea sp. NPDC058450 TaxID=3346505 RepID=UPI0036547F89